MAEVQTETHPVAGPLPDTCKKCQTRRVWQVEVQEVERERIVSFLPFTFTTSVDEYEQLVCLECLWTSDPIRGEIDD